MLPIECKILSLKLAIELLPATSEEEKFFLYLAQLDETRLTAALATEAHKNVLNLSMIKVLTLAYIQKVTYF